jgi:CheY-like chemotaxis protein
MNGILGLTDLVLHSDISGQKRTYMEMIHSSADRLIKLINNILDFSKIEAGKLELNMAPFSLRETIAGALEMLAVSASKKNIDLTVDCNKTIPDVLLGDAGKLSQILINLVGNAIKFTNTGNVGLTVLQEDQSKSQDGKQNDPVHLHFQIRDTGIGIPQEKIHNIFKAFSQISTSQNSNQRGTGLGLVIAGELVELMGGKICVDSKPEIGTTFYFTIRFAPGLAKAPAEETTDDNIVPPEQDKPAGKPLHILLVEDEYINRTLAVTVLEREGWKVTIAENGLQALDILQEASFDLILMDIQMPDMDGHETTRAIRRREKITGRHIPIIAMTAQATQDDREKCLAAGMDGYIAKPIRLDTIGCRIKTVLQSVGRESS